MARPPRPRSVAEASWCRWRSPFGAARDGGGGDLRAPSRRSGLRRGRRDGAAVPVGTRRQDERVARAKRRVQIQPVVPRDLGTIGADTRRCARHRVAVPRQHDLVGGIGDEPACVGLAGRGWPMSAPDGARRRGFRPVVEHDGARPVEGAAHAARSGARAAIARSLVCVILPILISQGAASCGRLPDSSARSVSHPAIHHPCRPPRLREAGRT